MDDPHDRVLYMASGNETWVAWSGCRDEWHGPVALRIVARIAVSFSRRHVVVGTLISQFEKKYHKLKHKLKQKLKHKYRNLKYKSSQPHETHRLCQAVGSEGRRPLT